MTDQTPIRMSVDEFLAWAPAQDGRWELVDGRPVTIPAETFDHIDVKFFVCLALKQAVARSKLPLHVLSDGATVRIDAQNANEPDALVYAGPKRPGRTIELSDPLIVVEVVSPTSGRRDRLDKRADYFSLPSVEHYLVVDPEQRCVLHLDRAGWQGEGWTMGEADTMELSPPGLELPVRRCFELA
jgi:Uma2 family endonuclease